MQNQRAGGVPTGQHGAKIDVDRSQRPGCNWVRGDPEQKELEEQRVYAHTHAEKRSSKGDTRR